MTMRGDSSGGSTPSRKALRKPESYLRRLLARNGNALRPGRYFLIDRSPDMVAGIPVAAEQQRVLHEFHAAVLNLYHHPEVRRLHRALVVKLDHVDPLAQKLSSLHFIAAKADATESPKSCASSSWYATN